MPEHVCTIENRGNTPEPYSRSTELDLEWSNLIEL